MTTKELPTLYHVPKTISSPIAQILIDLNLAETTVHIETLAFADLKSPEHLARNPMGTSPTFVDPHKMVVAQHTPRTPRTPSGTAHAHPTSPRSLRVVAGVCTQGICQGSQCLR